MRSQWLGLLRWFFRRCNKCFFEVILGLGFPYENNNDSVWILLVWDLGIYAVLSRTRNVEKIISEKLL